MYVMMKKLKMAKIKCTYFLMMVWGKVCFMLTKVHHFCGRNKMYKMASVVYRLHGKAFAMHDICYRKTKSMLEAVLKEMGE